ncbi:MAG: SPFH domain-containing protein [bacterium]
MNPGHSTVEREAFAVPGIVGVLFVLVFAGGAVAFGVLPGGSGAVVFIPIAIVLGVSAFLCLGGMFVIQPNQAEVLIFLGRYRGTVKKAGWYWTNPFTTKRKVTLRVQNFNTERLKVNDADGNPIEIAAVVVWRVHDTGRATFDVENYNQFVVVQAETSLRHIATQYPYDTGAKANQATLRGGAEIVGASLRSELQQRLAVAGVEVMETRLTHLAYSPEIAGAMLQRQQASAIIAARERIANGAVGIISEVLVSLKREGIVDLTQDQRARMVSSLLIVLTSERGAQPVLATAAEV